MSIIDTSSFDVDNHNVCIECGACCTTYRVSFYWYEAEANGLPPEMIRPLTPVYSCMAGTEAMPVRCVALQGRVGEAVSCGVYHQRPSPCREVEAGDDKCAKARAKHGLLPLQVAEEA